MMMWTEEDRRSVIYDLQFGLCSDLLLCFPEEVRRGDRPLTKKEMDLHSNLIGEVCQQEMNMTAEDIKNFPLEYQREFPDDVKNAKRPTTPRECISFKSIINIMPMDLDIDWEAERKRGSVGKIPWTEERRQDVLRFMRQISPEERRLFAEDLQKGDRFFTHWEAVLWGHFYDKYNYNWDLNENDPKKEKKDIDVLLNLIQTNINSGYVAFVMNTLYDFDDKGK